MDLQAWQLNMAIGLGVLIQYGRSLPWYKDWTAGVTMFSGALVIYWLGDTTPALLTKEFWRVFAVWFPGLMSAVGGGTWLTSKTATMLATNVAFVDPAHPLVPVTNNNR